MADSSRSAGAQRPQGPCDPRSPRRRRHGGRWQPPPWKSWRRPARAVLRRDSLVGGAHSVRRHGVTCGPCSRRRGPRCAQGRSAWPRGSLLRPRSPSPRSGELGPIGRPVDATHGARVAPLLGVTPQLLRRAAMDRRRGPSVHRRVSDLGAVVDHQVACHAVRAAWGVPGRRIERAPRSTRSWFSGFPDAPGISPCTRRTPSVC